MNFCSQCGSRIVVRVPPGDSLPRHVCDACGTIHYQNPKIIVGCIPAWENRVLLCRRAIEPRYGLWTVPAGFMENGETTLQGAVPTIAQTGLTEALEATLTPEQWLRRIIEARQAGRHDEADASLARLLVKEASISVPPEARRPAGRPSSQ